MITLAYRLTLQSVEQCQSWLTATEWQYCQALSRNRQLEFSNGRALVRQLLSQNPAQAIVDIAIDLPSDKAPALLLQGKPIQLSISHSGTAIAVAVSEQPIGLDIEQTKLRDFTALAQQFPALANATTLQQFYQHWTGCEAYSKCTGLTIWQVLQQPLPEDISLYYLPLSNYMLCLCYQDTSLPIQNLGELR
ncbi:hypothetical protein MN202_07730 [Rheinheimera muenzenbergensis]|uniref:4'-phosphopantetheinyl transferase n=1 Tax=Rheinheimera muenzenbergensis TaxID=1193628 RepID=A0ABU8C5D4_9GAMM